MGTDIKKLIKMIQDTPQELWQDDQTIHNVIEKFERESGKTYSPEIKKKYVQKFKRIASDPAARRLLPILLKTGKLDQILKKF